MKLNSAVWSVPSTSSTCSWRQVPAPALVRLPDVAVLAAREGQPVGRARRLERAEHRAGRAVDLDRGRVAVGQDREAAVAAEAELHRDGAAGLRRVRAGPDRREEAGERPRDREVGVRDVEEDVPDRLDLDAGVRRRRRSGASRPRAVVRRARRQHVRVRVPAVGRERDLHVRRADRRDVRVRRRPRSPSASSRPCTTPPCSAR